MPLLAGSVAFSRQLQRGEQVCAAWVGHLGRVVWRVGVAWIGV